VTARRTKRPRRPTSQQLSLAIVFELAAKLIVGRPDPSTCCEAIQFTCEHVLGSSGTGLAIDAIIALEDNFKNPGNRKEDCWMGPMHVGDSHVWVGFGTASAVRRARERRIYAMLMMSAIVRRA
jgi:hypothetical protein